MALVVEYGIDDGDDIIITSQCSVSRFWNISIRFEQADKTYQLFKTLSFDQIQAVLDIVMELHEQIHHGDHSYIAYTKANKKIIPSDGDKEKIK